MRAPSLLLLIATTGLFAQSSDMLITTESLANALKDPALVLLHVGSPKDYSAGHIPGARLLTLGDISITGQGGLRLELPPVPALVNVLQNLGISNSSRIVVYHGTPSVQSATRVWFTLDYLGLGNQAALLDGGLALWMAEGRSVSPEAPPAATAGTLTPQPRPELLVPAEWIHARAGSAELNLVDARTPEFYSGESAGNMPRAGRIPGARNVPFPTLFNANGTFKSKPELRQLLGTRTDPVVTYCHIGQQATVPYFAARLLGQEARLYDGSFQEWSSRRELPIDPPRQ